MENVSNKVLGLLNILTFLISIPIVFLGIQLHRVNGLATCFDLLRLPILVLGVLIMVMSVLGIIGACCRITWLLWTYNLVMSILIFTLIAVFMFALFVTWRSGGGTRIPGTEIKEYKLSEYTDWLQDRVKGKGWEKIHNCLVVANTCSLMPKNDTTLQDFNTKELNPVMSGCCKPLAECGFGYQSLSMWKKPNKMASSNADCKTWDNDPKVKCYNCDSCKAGVLQQAVATWRKTHFAKVILMVFLMILNNVGMCALKNARKKPDF